MDEIKFPEIMSRLGKADFGRYDIVCAVMSGGLIPAALAAQKLNLPLTSIGVSFRGADKKPLYESPRLTYVPELSGCRVLLADDVSKSGATLEAAKAALKGCEVTTFVLKGEADISLFDNPECVRWPWDALMR